MEPGPPVSARTAILRFPRKIRWKVTLGSPDLMFLRHFFFAGRKNAPPPWGSVRLARVTCGVRPGGSGHQNGRFVETKRIYVDKTVRSTDRRVALPGESNLTPRLRGEVDLRGARGRGRKLQTSRSKSSFLSPSWTLRKGDQTVS